VHSTVKCLEQLLMTEKGFGVERHLVVVVVGGGGGGGVKTVN
jgi:hypothetical protein